MAWISIHTAILMLYLPQLDLTPPLLLCIYTVYPKKYAHGFVVLYFVVVMQSFIMNSHEVFIHIHQGCSAGTGAIVRLPQCQWSKPDGYGKISRCITTTKHSKAKTVCIFLGIYCICVCVCWTVDWWPEGSSRYPHRLDSNKRTILKLLWRQDGYLLHHFRQRLIVNFAIWWDR